MLQNKFKTDALFDLLPPKMEEYFYRKLVGELQEEIRVKLIEFLKFCLLYPQAKCNIPFNAEIDEIWHLWILQTRQYQELMWINFRPMRVLILFAIFLIQLSPPFTNILFKRGVKERFFRRFKPIHSRN